MKQLLFLASGLLLMAVSSIAQVGINSDNSSPNPAAMLDVKATD
jgi:hypothetical protein